MKDRNYVASRLNLMPLWGQGFLQEFKAYPLAIMYDTY